MSRIFAMILLFLPLSFIYMFDESASNRLNENAYKNNRKRSQSVLDFYNKCSQPPQPNKQNNLVFLQIYCN